MALGTDYEYLLYEIYEATPLPEAYVVSDNDAVSARLSLPSSFRTTEPIIDQIKLAISTINSDINIENRVMEILDAYKGDSLDASNIDRDGYEFKLQRNLKNYRNLLKPYTGIFPMDQYGGGGGLLNIG